MSPPFKRLPLRFPNERLGKCDARKPAWPASYLSLSAFGIMSFVPLKRLLTRVSSHQWIGCRRRGTGENGIGKPWSFVPLGGHCHNTRPSEDRQRMERGHLLRVPTI